MAISMLKIRRPLGRLIFNMGIAIPGKTVFLIETAPRAQTMEHMPKIPMASLFMTLCNISYNPPTPLAECFCKLRGLVQRHTVTVAVYSSWPQVNHMDFVLDHIASTAKSLI